MTIIELLEQVGPGNIGVQLLEKCLVEARIVDGHGEITFATEPEYAISHLLEGVKTSCLILWLPVSIETAVLSGNNGTPPTAS